MRIVAKGNRRSSAALKTTTLDKNPKRAFHAWAEVAKAIVVVHDVWRYSGPLPTKCRIRLRHSGLKARGRSTKHFVTIPLTLYA
jgi:hypothetical protein